MRFKALEVYGWWDGPYSATLWDTETDGTTEDIHWATAIDWYTSPRVYLVTPIRSPEGVEVPYGDIDWSQAGGMLSAHSHENEGQN